MEMTGLGNRVFHGFERYQGMKKENSERMFQTGGGSEVAGLLLFAVFSLL